MSSQFDRSESFIKQLENTATAEQSAVSAAKLVDYILGQKPDLGNGKGNDNIAKNLIPDLEFDVCRYKADPQNPNRLIAYPKTCMQPGAREVLPIERPVPIRKRATGQPSPIFAVPH